MASAVHTVRAVNVPDLPFRIPSVLNRKSRPPVNNARTQGIRNNATAWELDALPSFQHALERVRQSHDAWQGEVSAAGAVARLEQQRMFDLFRWERERRHEAQRVAADERAARVAEQQRMRAEAQETARRAAMAAETERLATEAETRRLQAERRRRMEEERRRVEAEILLIRTLEEEDRRRQREFEAAVEAARLAEEEEERQRRREMEAAAEAARIAAEAEERRRQAEEEEQRRRARLRDCAACLEQLDMEQMIQTECRHWYCLDDLREAIQGACRARRPFQCCQQAVSANLIRRSVTPELLAQYSAMVEEATSPNAVYCSNPHCAVFLPARLATGPDEMACTQCRYRTCRHCKGRSHPGRECVADVATQKARALAGRQGWKACPTCQNMVEKSSGCMHMTCRCGAGFCYRCGRLLSQCGDRCG